MGKDGLSSPRLFSACLQALDVLSPPQRFPHEQGILIVERDDKSTLYAIEAVEYGLYVLCPLNDWVRLEDFDAQSGKARKIVHGIPTSNAATNDPWWKQAGVRFDTRQNRVPQNMIQPDIGSIRLSMKPVYPPLKVEDGVDSLLGDTILAVQPPDAEPVAPNLANKDAVVASNTDPEDVPSMIRAQYLDALYMSKVCLGMVLCAFDPDARPDISGILCKRTVITSTGCNCQRNTFNNTFGARGPSTWQYIANLFQ